MAPPRHRYTPYYCEENVWHLAGDPAVPPGERWAVFVSNAERRCPMWAQRAARSPDAPVVWDYHVVLLVGARARPAEIWDLDTCLALPASVERWLAGTFPLAGRLEPRFEPRFRVVAGDEFRARFASDRSHMRVGGRWRARPPDWPPIAAGAESMNLDRFVDVETPWLGELHDLSSFAARGLALGQRPARG